MQISKYFFKTTQYYVNHKAHGGEKNMTYRNSCLAVLVGDVGKSSSLQMKIQEKAGKQKGSK